MIDVALARVEGEGLARVTDPTPAVAFGGRRVCFLWSRRSGVVEVLERAQLLSGAKVIEDELKSRGMTSGSGVYRCFYAFRFRSPTSATHGWSSCPPCA